MFRERRKTTRREADRALLKRVADLEKLLSEYEGGMDALARKERRRAIRHKCKVKIQMMVRYSDTRTADWTVDSIEIKGRLLDLSAEGASLYTRKQFDASQQLNLTIILPDESKIVANSIVRWVKGLPEKGAFASGVQYESIDAKSRQNLENFLKYIGTLT